jgi:hypothetical protein
MAQLLYSPAFQAPFTRTIQRGIREVKRWPPDAGCTATMMW